MAKKRANHEGTITKRADGRWEAKIQVGIKPNGSPDRKSIYGRTQRDVKEKLEEIKSELRGGVYIASTDVRVEEWMHNWVDNYAKVATRTSTYNKYRSLIDNHIIPAIGGMKLQDLKTNNIQQLFATLLQGGNIRDNTALAASTVSEVHLILNQACKQAIACNLIRRNPVDDTKKPPREKPMINPYSEEEMNCFLKAVKNHRYFSAYYLECYSGIRRGELLGLKWSNVDFNSYSIKVLRSAKANSQEKSYLKTKHSMRIIPVGKKVINVLKSYKEKQDTCKKILGAAYVDNDLVFCGPTGKQLNVRAFIRAFERVLEQNELRKIRFHDLRHTHATILLLKGVNVKVVSERLGHSSVRITLDYYSHVIPGLQEQVPELLDQLIDDIETNNAFDD